MVRAFAGDSTITSLYAGLRLFKSNSSNAVEKLRRILYTSKRSCGLTPPKRQTEYQPFLNLSRPQFEFRGKFLHY